MKNHLLMAIVLLACTTASALAADIYINAGGSANGSFVADKDFGGAWSTTSTNSNTFNTSGVTNPASQIVYQQQRTVCHRSADSRPTT